VRSPWQRFAAYHATSAIAASVQPCIADYEWVQKGYAREFQVAKCSRQAGMLMKPEACD